MYVINVINCKRKSTYKYIKRSLRNVLNKKTVKTEIISLHHTVGIITSSGEDALKRY